jgi:hypothetical protein
VHFTESLAINQTSKGAFSVDSARTLIQTFVATTPWIALVSCDANSTDFSENVDIFTMASNAGAQSAVRSFGYLYVDNHNANYFIAASVFSLFHHLRHQSRVC